MAEQTGQTRDWTIIAPFFDGQGDGRWLDDFIDRPDLRFRKIASPAGARGDWHHGRSKTTDLRA